MWPILLAIVLVLLAVYTYYIRECNDFKTHGIPYVKPLPFLGSTFYTIIRKISFSELVEMSHNAHPGAKYIGMYDLMSPVIVLRDPELIKTVAVKNFDHFPDHRGFGSESGDPLFTKNLFALRGNRWKEVRNLMTPIFTTSKMRAMFKLMAECGNEFGSYITNLSPEESTMDIKDAFTRFTNDVIGTCVFGITVNSMKDRNNAFYVYGRDATNFSGIRAFKFFLLRSCSFLSKWFGIRLMKKEIAEFFMKLVADTMKARDEQGIVRPDAIQQLMENRSKADLDLEDITAQAFIFFLAGFDTTATVMSFAAHELAANPEVQEKLYAEIEKVLDETKTTNVNYETLNGMPYLEAVIYETLRMYPVAILGDRVCTKSFELPPTIPGSKPYVVKPGSYIWFPFYGLQRDAKYYPEPSRFNPERFIEDPKLANSAVFLTFGLGPRMCIGNRFALLEMKVVLFHILARAVLKPCARTTIPMKLSKTNLNMLPEDGFWLTIEPRKNLHPALAVPATNDSVHS